MKHWLLVASWLKIKTYSDSSPAELIFASKYLLCLFPKEAVVSSYWISASIVPHEMLQNIIVIVPRGNWGNIIGVSCHHGLQYKLTLWCCFMLLHLGTAAVESSHQYIFLLIQGLAIYNIILDNFSTDYFESSDQYIFLVVQGLVMCNIIEDFSAQYIESSDQYIYLLIQGLIMYNIILEDFSAQYIELSDQYIYLLIQGLAMSNIILDDLSAQYIESSDQ